jgi:pimeloyl-ACP methyl ester carboxylesterase
MTKSFKIAVLFVVANVVLNGLTLGQTGTLEANYQSPIKVEVIGKGKPILFLPGFTVPGSMWKETIDNLSMKRKSYLFSYAGFNGIDPIKMPWYESIKGAIIEYIRVNDMSDIIIIGHSMGGNLAVDIASELPDKVTKLIIVEALPCMREVMMPGVPAEGLYYDSPYNRKMLEMDDQQFKSMASMMASNMTIKTDKKEVLTNWTLEADRKTWVYGYTDLLKIDLRPSLDKITCTSLILGASFPDVKLAQENYEKQYLNLSNKTIKMAERSKHFIMFDQPIWFYKTLNDFLVDEN